jgi:hypothetical protein
MKKNPVIASILNFFLPGIGFTYIGTPLLIFGGILLFICDLIISFLDDWTDVKVWLLGFFGNFSYAILGYGIAEIYNKKFGTAE